MNQFKHHVQKELKNILNKLILLMNNQQDQKKEQENLHQMMKMKNKVIIDLKKNGKIIIIHLIDMIEEIDMKDVMILEEEIDKIEEIDQIDIVDLKVITNFKEMMIDLTEEDKEENL